MYIFYGICYFIFYCIGSFSVTYACQSYSDLYGSCNHCGDPLKRVTTTSKGFCSTKKSVHQTLILTWTVKIGCICLKPLNTEKLINASTKCHHFDSIISIAFDHCNPYEIPLMLPGVSVMLIRHWPSKCVDIIKHQDTIWATGGKDQWRHITIIRPPRVWINLR